MNIQLRLFSLLAGMLLLVVAARADDGDTVSGTSSRSRGLCGTMLIGGTDRDAALRNTESRDPDAYRRMLVRGMFGSPLMKRAEADTIHTFNVFNWKLDSYDEVTATLRFSGTHARIWLDTSMTSVSAAVILELARALDSATPARSRNPNQGIIQNDVDVFGPVPTNVWKGDHMTEFLLTDVTQVSTSDPLLGFFDPYDQDPDFPLSNRANILYLDVREGLQAGMTTLLSTAAHEFQHLLHHARNESSEPFFNEGCSEEASLLNGYADRGNNTFLADANIYLFRWDARYADADYERALTFIHYLREQFGEQFLHELVGRLERGTERIDWTLSALGLYENPYTWVDIAENFMIANLLGKSDNPLYSYREPIGAGGTAKPHRSYDLRAVPADTTYRVQAIAPLYLAYTNDSMRSEGLTLELSGTSTPAIPFTVIAVLTRGDQTEVRRLGGPGSYTFGGSLPYDRILLAVIGTSLESERVRVVAKRVTLGVAAEGGAGAEGMALSAHPNPTGGGASIGFVTARGGEVSLSLFDMQGRRVRSLVDGERYEAGTHAVHLEPGELPAGSYVLRLVQEGRVLARPIVLVR